MSTTTTLAPHHISTPVDNEYLLRCAVTHDWDAIIAVCTQHKHDLSNNELALYACDQYGNSVVQLACYHRPPVSVIRSLLNSSHSRARRQLVRHRATDDSTALQVACATGASIEVIRLLVTYARDLVGAADRQGSTPISELTIQYALERLTPCERKQSLPLDEIHSIQHELSKEGSTLFRIFWTKLSILLDPTTSDDANGVCQAAAALAHAVPNELTDLLLRSSTPVDLPNALVIALHQPCCSQLVQQHRQEYFVTRLLQHCTCTMIHHDALSMAVQHGYRFHPVLHTLATLAPNTIGANLATVVQYGTEDDIFGILRLQPQALNEFRQMMAGQ